jgi:[ribosomal protein S5]-alanine N-acetyltransferase
MNIETSRLLLSDYAENDENLLYEILNDSDVNHYLQVPDISRDGVQKSFKVFSEDRTKTNRIFYYFKVQLKTTHEYIGEIGFKISQKNEFGGSAHVGYMLKSVFRNKGYASEGLIECVNFGFHNLNLHKMTASINPENMNSKKLLEKVGFRRNAILREERLVKNKWEDIELYELLKKDFIVEKIR